MSYSALAGLWVVEDECLVGLFCSWEKAYDRLLLFMPLCLGIGQDLVLIIQKHSY